MNIVLSTNFYGPHNNEYRLPDDEGIEFEQAVKTLSRFIDFYSTSPVVTFYLSPESFSEAQKVHLKTLFSKKNLKIS